MDRISDHGVIGSRASPTYSPFLRVKSSNLVARWFTGENPVPLRNRRERFANKLHRRMLEAHTVAMRDYFPDLYPGRVVLFRSKELDRQKRRLEHYFGRPEMGWNELAQGGVELYWLPGGHHEMFYGENAPVFAARVRECMGHAPHEQGFCA